MSRAMRWRSWSIASSSFNAPLIAPSPAGSNVPSGPEMVINWATDEAPTALSGDLGGRGERVARDGLLIPGDFVDFVERFERLAGRGFFFGGLGGGSDGAGE